MGAFFFQVLGKYAAVLMIQSSWDQIVLYVEYELKWSCI